MEELGPERDPATGSVHGSRLSEAQPIECRNEYHAVPPSETLRTWHQTNAVAVQPRKRCVRSKASWWVVRTLG